jgi:hypothetical protein
MWKNWERLFQYIFDHWATKLCPRVMPSLNNNLVNKDDLVKTEKDIIRVVCMDGFVSTVVDDPFREHIHTVLINMVLGTSKTSQIKMTLVLLVCISSTVGRSGGDNFAALDLSIMCVHMELVVVIAVLA